jgi:excisionase family DNA binding protein
MLSTKEAAQRLGLKTTGAVRQFILMGKLKAEKRGRDWWIDEKSLEQFQSERRGRGRPKAAPAAHDEPGQG